MPQNACHKINNEVSIQNGCCKEHSTDTVAQNKAHTCHVWVKCEFLTAKLN